MQQLTWLNENQPPNFPPLEAALTEPNGLLAAGGQLTPEWLLVAYQQGIFPWFSEDDPILWWSPAPRCVFHATPPIINRRMRRALRKMPQLRITLDEDFDLVMAACAQADRGGQPGTWILPEMQQAYQALFTQGHATAIGVWDQDELIGGLYGVSMGQMLFGESMFSHRSGGSKIALATAQWLMRKGVWQMLDAQVASPHLISLGAQEMPRQLFIKTMSNAVSAPLKNRTELFCSELCLHDLKQQDF